MATATVRVTLRLLQKLLELPDSVEITAVSVHPYQDRCIELTVAHPNIPEGTGLIFPVRRPPIAWPHIPEG